MKEATIHFHYLMNHVLTCDGMYRTQLIVQTYEKGQKKPTSNSFTELSKS